MTFNTDAGQKQLPVVDILNAMASKFNAYHSRQEDKDHRDILFLVTKYPEEVFAFRIQRNATHRQYFVASFTQRNPQNTVRRIKHVLGVA